MGGLQVPADRWTSTVEATIGPHALDFSRRSRISRDGAAHGLRWIFAPDSFLPE